jgi:two-component system, NtrC family, response regulator GlrR
MNASRCFIVPLDTPQDAQDKVLAAIAADPRISVELAGTAPAAVNACGAVVFVSGAGDFDDLVGLVEAWRRACPSTAIVVVASGFDDGRFARLLAAGIHDFVTLPLQPNELLARMRRALGLVCVDARTVRLVVHPRLQHFIGSHASFVAQVAKLPLLADCDASVLVLGETGTGKEVCAQAIHYLSARASRPWVAINCGAMPTELVENELFGHVKGAYTTAHAPRSGLVREAEGGTLFLDDVDCLPLSAQVKLLRFVQEREYRAVGSNHVQHADVRIVAASNLRLPQMVARGEFRQDLFFRLNVLTLELPALRDRADDIPALALHFLRHFSERHGRHVTTLTAAALDKLLAHDWPGNVRELQHAMERAVLLAPGPTLSPDDVEIAGASSPSRADDAASTFSSAKAKVVRQFERGYIERVLANCGGNVTRAAEAAGKDRRAFFELMRKHEISASRFRAEP